MLGLVKHSTQPTLRAHWIGRLSRWAFEIISRSESDWSLGAGTLVLTFSFPCACQTSIVATPSHKADMMTPAFKIRFAGMGFVDMVVSPLWLAGAPASSLAARLRGRGFLVCDAHHILLDCALQQDSGLGPGLVACAGRFVHNTARKC